jgi:hypothetical protein
MQCARDTGQAGLAGQRVGGACGGGGFGGGIGGPGKSGVARGGGGGVEGRGGSHKMTGHFNCDAQSDICEIEAGRSEALVGIHAAASKAARMRKAMNAVRRISRGGFSDRA